MAPQYIRFACGALQLEGALHLPEGEGPFPGVVVSHPHPLMGGDMSNNVVKALCTALVKQGIGALRFNFRGVGLSTGRYEEGAGEQDDVLAAVSYLISNPQIKGGAVGVAGYSFGAYVSLAAGCRDDGVQAVAAVSPPARMFDFSFLQRYAKPKLIVSGARDDFTSQETISQLFDALPEPKRLVIEQADHFWFGREELAAQPVADFFAEVLLQSQSV